MRVLFLTLLLSASAFAEVPEPIRDSAADWRCVDSEYNVISNHQRQDKAIVACQKASLANLGETFYIEGGRYRVTATEAPAIPGLAPYITDPDFEYTSIPYFCPLTPDGFQCASIHPYAPPGSLVRVEATHGTNVQVTPAGAAWADSAEFGVRVSYKVMDQWTQPEDIAWMPEG